MADPHPQPEASDPNREQDLLLVWAALADLAPGRGTVREVTEAVRVRALRLGHRPPSAFRVAGLLWDLAERRRVVPVAFPGGRQVWTDRQHAQEVIASATSYRSRGAA